MIVSENKDIILVQGFGWTGSGALVDFLLDNENVKLASNDEIPFLKALVSLIDKAKKRKKFDLNNGADEILFAGVTPNSYTSEMKSLYDMRLNRFFSLSNVSREDYTKYVTRIVSKLSEISQRSIFIKIDEREISNIISEYWVYLNSILEDGSKILMYDNLISLQRLDLLAELDYSKIGSIRMYVIDRDPRDQFYELYKLFKNGYSIHYSKLLRMFTNVRSFPTLLNSNFVKYCAAVLFVYVYHKPKRIGYKKGVEYLKKNTNAVSIHNIRFEDFVLNTHSSSDIVKDDIDRILKQKYERSLWNLGENFDPNMSKQNIGLYKKEKHIKLYKFISKAVTKYNS